MFSTSLSFKIIKKISYPCVLLFYIRLANAHDQFVFIQLSKTWEVWTDTNGIVIGPIYVYYIICAPKYYHYKYHSVVLIEVYKYILGI